MYVVDQVNQRRGITRVDQLPSREQLEADTLATQAILLQQIILVYDNIENEVRANGEGLPIETHARDRAEWFINHQDDDDVTAWTNSLLVDELLERLRDYLQIFGEPSPSEVESSTETETDAEV